jgi:O-succinylbenzoate synthase
VNALISATGDDIEPEIDRVLSSGYRTVKVKVGRQSLDDDIVMVRRVCSTAGSRLAVRLDANRAWSFDNALTFARAIEQCGIEYLEEPLERAVAMEAFSRETELPLALDESLLEYTPETLPLSHGTAAIVIRPMLLGGYERSMMFARRAQSQGVRTVVSSAVESAVGTGTLVSFAAAMNPQDIAAGLDTISWFAAQPVKANYSITDGQLQSDAIFSSSQDVDEKVLKEVADD